MAAASGYEIEYRIQGSGQEWTRVRVGPQPVHSLRGLRRGETYDYRVRGLSADKASGYTAGSFTVATTAREGPLALPPVNVGNVGAIWDTGAEATWTATDTLADISVSAGNLVAGEETAIAYSASAGQVAGTASAVKTVHLYYDDPKLEGGLRTLGITESLVTARTGNNGRIYIATLVITFDTLGGGGTGGGGGIGGGGGGSGQIEP